MIEDHCEICGQPGPVWVAWVLDPWGNWRQAWLHIACETDRMAKMRSRAAWN